MDVSGVSNTTSQAGSAAKALSGNFDTFLKLLTAQLQNQDPLEPMDTSEFTRPVLVSLDPARPRVTISATRGSATSKGEQTDLHGQVELLRAGGEGKPPLRVSTDHVRILPEQDLALTERPVRIESGDSVLTGVGMRFNNADRTLDVLSRVQSRWVGRAARPDTAAR